MKHIKKFEDNIGEPWIGSYVITHFRTPTVTYISEDGVSTLLDDYVSNNIGKIIKMSGSSNFLIQYGEGSWWFKKDEIIHWSDNKDELELIIRAKKYNL